MKKYLLMALLGLMWAGPVQESMAQFYYPYPAAPFYGQPMYYPYMPPRVYPSYPPMPAYNPYAQAPAFNPYAAPPMQGPGLGANVPPQGMNPEMTHPPQERDRQGYDLVPDVAGMGPGFVPRTRGYALLPMPPFDPKMPAPRIDSSGYDFVPNTPKFGPAFVPRNPDYPILPEPKDQGPDYDRRLAGMNTPRNPNFIARTPDSIPPLPGRDGNDFPAPPPGPDGVNKGNPVADPSAFPSPFGNPGDSSTLNWPNSNKPGTSGEPPLFQQPPTDGLSNFAKDSLASIPGDQPRLQPNPDLTPTLPTLPNPTCQGPGCRNTNLHIGIFHDHIDPNAPVDLGEVRPDPGLPPNPFTFQVMGGYYHNMTSPAYNYEVASIRIGKLFNCPCLDNCWLRGAFEPILELNGAPTQELGHVFAGTSFILRYNFIQPECRLVPYVQVGAGVQYNDAYRDATQTALGQPMEFVGSAQVGLRWFWLPHLSIDIEGGYMIFNNFNQSPRNDGIHALGGSIGLTYYFPCRNR